MIWLTQAVPSGGRGNLKAEACITLSEHLQSESLSLGGQTKATQWQRGDGTEILGSRQGVLTVERGMAHSVCGTLPTGQLPGRLCGTWVAVAACGRGAAWGGLECKPARRPERRQEGEEQTHAVKTGMARRPGGREPQRTYRAGSGWRPPGEGSAYSHESCLWSHQMTR